MINFKTWTVQNNTPKRIDEASDFYMEKQDLKELADSIKKVEDGIDDIVKFCRYTGSYVSDLLRYLDHVDDARTKTLISKMISDKQKEIKAMGNKVSTAADAIDKMFAGRNSMIAGIYDTLENIKKSL